MVTTNVALVSSQSRCIQHAMIIDTVSCHGKVCHPRWLCSDISRDVMVMPSTKVEAWDAYNEQILLTSGLIVVRHLLWLFVRALKLNCTRLESHLTVTAVLQPTEAALTFYIVGVLSSSVGP
jgi:hypothetical protein